MSTDQPLASDRIFSVGDYVSEELATRGWSYAFAAARAKGDLDHNTVWLRLICHRTMWWEYHALLSQKEADRLACIFGTSSELFMNIHNRFQAEKAKLSQEEIDAAVKAIREKI